MGYFGLSCRYPPRGIPTKNKTGFSHRLSGEQLWASGIALDPDLPRAVAHVGPDFVFSHIESHVSDDTSLVSLVQDVDTSRQTKIKPCARFVDKKACVREIFKAYQTCAPIYYPKPSPLIRTNYLAYIPSVNSTAVLPYSEVSGLNGRIKDFQ